MVTQFSIFATKVSDIRQDTEISMAVANTVTKSQEKQSAADQTNLRRLLGIRFFT